MTPTPSRTVSPSQPTAEPVRRCKHDVSEDCPACAEETIAGLKARCVELEAALRPFAEIAPFVEFTDFRDGNIVHRQHDREGKRHELTKDHFRKAAKAAALSPSTPAVSR